MTWKLKTRRGNAVHLYKLGADKTLCGKPQENYDTEEGTYTLDQFKRLHGSCHCKKCATKAQEFELLGSSKS